MVVLSEPKKGRVDIAKLTMNPEAGLRGTTPASNFGIPGGGHVQNQPYTVRGIYLEKIPEHYKEHKVKDHVVEGDHLSNLQDHMKQLKSASNPTEAAGPESPTEKPMSNAAIESKEAIQEPSTSGGSTSKS